MRETSVRLRASISNNFALVVAGLVVVGLLGGYVTYGTYVEPATTTETRQVSSWQSTADFTHRATVINGTEAFAEGSVLHNRSAYFRKMSPRLNGSFTYGYTATAGGNLTANATLVLVIRSVQTLHDGNETVYWRLERPLGTTGSTRLNPGEAAQIPFSVNVSASKQLADRIESRVGDTPGTPSVHFLARVTLSGTRNGNSVDRTRIYRLPIRFEQGVYEVRDPGQVVDSGRETETQTVPVQYGPLRRMGGPLLVVLSVVGLLALLGGRYTGRLAVSETERDWLAYRNDREEFDDWITVGRMPAESSDWTSVEVDSLSGLVDTAIDTDNRVIEDRQRRHFVVLSDSVAYVYEPPSLSPDGVLGADGS